MTFKKDLNVSIARLALSLALFGLTVGSPVRAQEADQPNPQLESAISFITSALPAGIDLDVAAVLPPPPLDGDADAAMLGPGMHMFKGELALTDDQYEKMYNLRNDFLDKLGPKMAEVSSLERHMRDVLTSPSIDAKKAAELKTKLAAAKSDLTEMKSDMQLQMAQVLTADQRKHLRLAMSKCPMMGRMCSGRMSRSKWSHHGGPSMGSWGRGPGGPECK